MNTTQSTKTVCRGARIVTLSGKVEVVKGDVETCGQVSYVEVETDDVARRTIELWQILEVL